MNKPRETRERHTDKFHNSMSSLGFEPPNLGMAAIVADHVVLDQISLVHKVYRKYCKQTLPLR